MNFVDHRANTRATHPGFYLGEFADNRKILLRNKIINLSQLTFGAPGSSKTAGLLIPNIAHIRQSKIIADFKGSITPVTRRVRGRMGRVIVMNPTNFRCEEIPALKGQKWNPLHQTKSDEPNFMGDCRCIANTILTKGGNSGSAKFFDISAENIVTLFLAYERATNGDKASLRNVRSKLSEPSVFNEKGEPVSGFARTVVEMCLSNIYAIRTAALRLLGRLTDPKSMGTSLQDVIDTALKDFNFLDSDTVADNMSEGSIDFASLRKEITTIYLVIPVEELAAEGVGGKYLRLFVNLALRNLYRNPPPLDAPLPPVCFYLDEFGNCGRFSEIPKMLAMGRELGISAWYALQSLSQLKSNYPEWNLFFNGAGSWTTFRCADLETAELFSKIIGNGEQHVMTENQNGGASLTPQAIPLIRAEDLMRLPDSMSINWIAPCPYPIKAHVPIYPQTQWDAELDPSPYHRR